MNKTIQFKILGTSILSEFCGTLHVLAAKKQMVKLQEKHMKTAEDLTEENMQRPMQTLMHWITDINQLTSLR